MSWVKEADLTDLPAIFKAVSLNSQAMELVEQLNEGLAFGSSVLTRAQEEAIATVVSVANRCQYGALTHGGFYRKNADDSGIASQLLDDYTQANLAPADRAMLDFAVKVTLEPAGLTQEDLEGLREEGLADEEILSIVLITCLFNFMNRIANSLGVEAPEPFVRSVGKWLTGAAAQESWLLGAEASQKTGDLSWHGLETALGEISKIRLSQPAGDDQETGLIEQVPGPGPIPPPPPPTVEPPVESVEDTPTVEAFETDLDPGDGLVVSDLIVDNLLTEETSVRTGEEPEQADHAPLRKIQKKRRKSP